MKPPTDVNVTITVPAHVAYLIERGITADAPAGMRAWVEGLVRDAFLNEQERCTSNLGGACLRGLEGARSASVLPNRVVTALHNAGITTVEAVQALPDAYLLQLPLIGPGALATIRAVYPAVYAYPRLTPPGYAARRWLNAAFKRWCIGSWRQWPGRDQ